MNQNKDFAVLISILLTIIIVFSMIISCEELRIKENAKQGFCTYSVKGVKDSQKE